MRLTDFNNLTHFGLEDPRMTTIGGVAFRYLDRLPRVGDQVIIEGLSLSILEMDDHRISRIRVAHAVAEEALSELEEEDRAALMSETSRTADIDITEAVISHHTDLSTTSLMSDSSQRPSTDEVDETIPPVATHRQQGRT